MDHTIINKLETQIINLTNAFKKMRKENDELRNKQALLNKDRHRLEELNKSAAAKIKNIVHKINTMEN